MFFFSPQVAAWEGRYYRDLMVMDCTRRNLLSRQLHTTMVDDGSRWLLEMEGRHGIGMFYLWLTEYHIVHYRTISRTRCERQHPIHSLAPFLPPLLPLSILLSHVKEASHEGGLSINLPYLKALDGASPLVAVKYITVGGIPYPRAHLSTNMLSLFNKLWSWHEQDTQDALYTCHHRPVSLAVT